MECYWLCLLHARRCSVLLTFLSLLCPISGQLPHFQLSGMTMPGRLLFPVLLPWEFWLPPS